jgi:hypothetical protein
VFCEIIYLVHCPKSYEQILAVKWKVKWISTRRWNCPLDYFQAKSWNISCFFVRELMKWHLFLKSSWLSGAEYIPLSIRATGRHEIKGIIPNVVKSLYFHFFLRHFHVISRKVKMVNNFSLLHGHIHAITWHCSPPYIFTL